MSEDRFDDLFGLLLPAFVKEGNSYLSLAVGCTGGRHRSVVLAEELAKLPTLFDWVINTVSSTKGGVEEYEQVYLNGTRHLLEFAFRSALPTVPDSFSFGARDFLARWRSCRRSAFPGHDARTSPRS